jgi:protein-tyrosine phosphatase
MVQRLRSLAKGVLHGVTKLLHPWRRRRALRRLAAAAPVESVLFLCLGNVCRSPYAESSFRHMSPATTLDSAGFIGPDRSPPEDARLIARERGVDVTSHVSKLITTELVRSQDLVVVMEPGQAKRLRREMGAGKTVVVLGDLDPERPRRRRIRDPWGQPPEVFRSSFERIDRCLDAILPFVATHPGSEAGRTHP